MQIQLRYKFFSILLLIGLLSSQQLFSFNIYQQHFTLPGEILYDSLFIQDSFFRQDSLSLQDSLPVSLVVDPMFLPVVFTGKVVPEGYSNNKWNEPPKFSEIEDFVPDYKLNDISSSVFEKRKRKQELSQKAYLYLTINNPEVVKYTLNDFPENPDTVKLLKVNPFDNLFKIDTSTDFYQPDALEKFMFRRYWFIDGNHLLQFSQNYISNNWFNGGVGSLNILSNQSVRVRYEKERVQFNTLLEWNTSILANPNDTVRKTRMGADLLRSFSNFGFRAFNRWYYSINIELKTQVFNDYSQDDAHVKISSFMSPFSMNVGILGMRYELDKKFKENKYKSLKIAADISPLSVKYISVSSPAVDPARYGIPEGKRSRADMGSSVNATMTYSINRYTLLKSRFKYFTSYHKTEIESENELNFSLNRYFSTRIYLYLRYDDSENIPKDPTLGYLQINELVSFGFNYRW